MTSKIQAIDDLDLAAPMEKLSREIRQMAGDIPATQARNLVDLYYRLQEHRIQAAGQMRALSVDGRPTDIAEHFTHQMGQLEKQMQAVLDVYSMSSDVGRWSRSVHGIGPVIAAALLAHIDITKAPTAGHIWRFAGLDPTIKWHGVKNANELVSSAWKVEDHPLDAVWWLSEATSRRMTDLLETGGVDPVERDQVTKVLADVTGLSPNRIADLADTYILHDDNLIRRTCEVVDVHPLNVYSTLYDEMLPKFDKAAIIKLLSRRPWNSKLKVLCWKIGESFVKFSNHENCFYGHLYRERKEQEKARDKRGDNAATAARTLEEKNITHPETKATYKSGHLPDGRIDMRARRYVVKIFLAHWQFVAFESHYGMPAPHPYILTHDHGHVHNITPPGYEPLGR